MQKTENPETGVVHWVSNEECKKILLECVCGVETGLVWTKADDKNVTCRKCLSIMGEV